MRLNRVLLLAAAISMAVFAMVFTISCSDGESGKNGATCIARDADGGGWDIFCGDVKAGTLASPDGKNGDKGPTGQAGADNNKDCDLGPNIGGTYQVICDGQLKGSLEGCNAFQVGKFETNVICVGSSQLSICNGQLFDPASRYCDNAGTLQPDPASCNGVAFNKDRQYCGYLNEVSYEARKPSPLTLCGFLNSEGPAASPTKPNEADTLNLFELADAPWKDEYCQASRELLKRQSPAITVEDSIVTTYNLAKPERCGGANVKINDGEWKGEYCGFADAGAVSKSVVASACGDGGEPNKEGFGKKYCRMYSKYDLYTKLAGADEFCEATEPDSSKVKKTLNQVDKFTALTTKDWLGEYCGYASKAAETASAKVRLTGICDDGSGPNETAFENDYCTVLPENSRAVTSNTGAVTPAGYTTKVGGKTIDAYCINDQGLENYLTLGDGQRMNKDRWQDQYCGFSSLAADTTRSPTVQRGVCYKQGATPEYTYPNQQEWKNGYCQGQPTGGTIANNTGAADAATKGPGVTTAYCGVKGTSKNSNTNGRYNEGSWKGQYCAFTSLSNWNNGVVSIVTPSATQGMCDLAGVGGAGDIMPNEYNRVIDLGFWPNDYCQVKPANRANGKTTRVGIESNWKWGLKDSILNVFCLQDTAAKTGITAPSGADYDADKATDYLSAYQGATTNQRLNSYKWSNQYCGFSSINNILTGSLTLADGTTIDPTVAGRQIFTRLTGFCDNADGSSSKNSPVAPNAAYTGAIAYTEWLSQYCQVREGNKRTGITTLASLGGSGDNKTADYKEFCTKQFSASSNKSYSDSIATLNSGSLSSVRLNAGTWQGQYCFRDTVRAQCFAGQVPVEFDADKTEPKDLTTAYSTDNKKCW